MKIIRQAIERLSRGRIIKRKIQVNRELFPILVSPDAQLKYLKYGSNSFDRDLLEIAEKHLDQDSNVWDIGANVGVFTFAASAVAKNGMILSVEADIWLANILRKTVSYKEYREHDIRVLPCAISDENSVACFHVASRGRASNALEVVGGRSQMGGVRESQYVPTCTLDNLLGSFTAPDFVKIDIEGAELMALQGASELINNVRPVFYIEVGENVSKEIFMIFDTANYIARGLDGRQLIECSDNTFFFPKEK